MDFQKRLQSPHLKALRLDGSSVILRWEEDSSPQTPQLIGHWMLAGPFGVLGEVTVFSSGKSLKGLMAKDLFYSIPSSWGISTPFLKEHWGAT